jgi:rhodanese-related sulfurtransferase
MQRLSKAEFLKLIEEGAQLVDSRSVSLSAESVFENAVCIPWGVEFLETFQNLITTELGVVIVAEERNIPAIAKAIAGSGFSGFKGVVLQEELEAMPQSVIITVEADEFSIDFNHDEFYLIDVRSQEEFEAEHIEHAENIPLDDLEAMSHELAENMRIYVVGNNANQTFTAVSLLKLNGIELARAVSATFDELRQAGLPMIKPKKTNNTNA